MELVNAIHQSNEVRDRYRRYYAHAKTTIITEDAVDDAHFSDLMEDIGYAMLPKQSPRSDGYIYVITNAAWEGYVKVGRAVDPFDRLRSLQTSDPYRQFVLEDFVYVADRKASEAIVHNKLAQWRVAGEWFFCSVNRAVAAVNEVRGHVH